VSSQLIARVAIESPLPQLDRLFDYAVAPELADQIKVGQRVKVTFGRSKVSQPALVVEISDSSNHDGKLSQITELVSTVPVLQTRVYKLARQIADRQCTTLSDVIRLAVPNRSVAVEKKWLVAQSESAAQLENNPLVLDRSNATKTTQIVQPVCTEWPTWASELANRAISTLESGASTIICVPDQADIQVIERLLASRDVDFRVQHSDQKNSANYGVFLRCLESQPLIVVGNRNALFAPVPNLGLILLWDDGDHSHIMQQSPYIHSRDIALMRQQIEGCSIHFASHVRSAETARLISIGYLTDVTAAFAPPKVAVSESGQRLDTAAWLAIREASNAGPVLVQVGAKGASVSLYCASCSTRASCSDCNGPLWVNERNQNSCRWCNRICIDAQCNECGSVKFRQGRAGATRTSTEIGKMFPGVKILTSSGSERLFTVDEKPKVVVATVGAEPIAAGGYSAVVILDADQLLRRDTLRATEDAVRAWANAIALLSPKGRALLVGLTGKLATDFALWNHAAIANRELDSRSELELPPAVRVATITADSTRLEQCAEALAHIESVEVFGPSTRNGDLRLLIKFSYRAGHEVSEKLRVLALSQTAGGSILNQKSGRAQRALRIKIDDPEVI
jgi:primosomal protein N' (replication factor Y) (superfamily II helicase)